MSISVYLGHNGQRLTLDPSLTTNLEALRAWIATHANVLPRNQILLTAHGKQVRPQTLLTEKELFVFDSVRLNGNKASSPSREATESASAADHDFHPGTAPDTIANQNEIQSWQNLFRLRKSWAAGLLNGCSSRAKQAEQYQRERATIERSLGVAVAGLQQHIKTAEKQFASTETWASEVLADQQAHADNWERNLVSLRDIPARAEFTRFIQPMVSSTGSRRLSQQHISTLQGFVDVVTVKQAAGSARSLIGELGGKVDKLRADLDNVTSDSNDLLQAVEQINNPTPNESDSEPSQLIEEINMVVAKMASDFEHVQTLKQSAQNVSAVSKMALLHTRSYVPNLGDYCEEMNALVRTTKEKREGAAEMALEHMRTLSAIESQLAKLYQDIKELDLPEDQQQAFVTLSIVSRLPSVYAQLLVESVRRREWVAKMKRDCSTLQEEVAAYQEEEDKRRKKWMRSVDDVVLPESLQSRVLGIELSLQNEGGSWPMTTREELTDYMNVLTSVYGQGPVTDEVDQAIKDLDKPTRRQIKHARAFKNGSLHEAAFGDTSLLLRGDEQYKSLRESNIRLAEELRGQKSRVRKLEDLLHRQTQITRASTGDVFTPTSDGTFSNRVGTPVAQYEDTSRHNSMSKRRSSVIQGQGLEERRLAQRIVDLEAELQSYKDDLTSRKNSDAEFQKQVEEATLTKKDLMENMEAQGREFANERRQLEQELAEAREKLEEAENEMERMAGSHDGADEEIARLKEDAAGHAARAATEHDARSALERRLEIAGAAQAEAERELREIRNEREVAREVENEQLQTLTAAHGHLLPNAEPPAGLIGLATALEELARKSAAHVKDLQEGIDFAKSENGSLWTSNERQKTELATALQRQAETEEQVREAQNKLAAEEARARSFEEQLEEEQEQLRTLRNKFAEGETGSAVLRQRVTEEEDRCRKLSTELTEARSHINVLDIELMRLQKNHEAHHETAEANSDRLAKRAERAKQVSQRLYSQNMRLARLLERLGLVVAYQDDRMTVERASKMAASTTILDPQTQMSRQISSPPPTRKSSSADVEPPADLELLRWSDASSADEETLQYGSFLSHIARFDLDVFADAVTKRVKDFEYTAKKYSKEAKESAKRADAYKERAVRLRNEAHAKIAVRDFKEGDLALFLPTRGGQVKGAWAAFNIGCPHFFLAEREGMRLGTRDFIVARIQKVEQKIVNLSGQRTGGNLAVDGRSIDETSDAFSSMHVEDDNPFDLSDGLTWWMVHAAEERGAGAAPTTPGLGKSTVAAANVDATGSIRSMAPPKRNSKGEAQSDATKHLNKSLDSRRSSSTSKKGISGSTPVDAGNHRQRSESQASSLNQQQPRPMPAPAGSGLGIVSNANDHEGSSSSSSAQQQQRPPSRGQQPPQQITAAPPQHDQIPNTPTTIPSRRASPTNININTNINPNINNNNNSRPRTRSKSPSKSVRSLQRHLEPTQQQQQPPSSSSSQQPPQSPVKTPTTTTKKERGKSGWESLFSAEFSLESPTKEKKSFA
ncbi:Autophagy-related 11 [Lecanosticta acicola]|uniref:Autophagy-related protein 11 n=1 Tax=Lecanosticta acicola TaxID=111012 RepID=A0AAI8YVA6_9PEZI|nr:Autophagy-related 11 [Lecanosticta acicola]